MELNLVGDAESVSKEIYQTVLPCGKRRRAEAPAMVLCASSFRCLSCNRRKRKSWLLASPASLDATQDGAVGTVVVLTDAQGPKRREELVMRTHLDAMVDGALLHMRGG